MPVLTQLAGRLADVDRRVTAAAERAGRARAEVTVVAVSKRFDADAVRSALQAGQTDFGESQAQELRRKAAQVGDGVRWHFVGRLQRNKVPELVGLVSLVHSVDRIELAEALAARARAGRASTGAPAQRVLVQVNAGEDPRKGGCSVGDAGALVSRVRELDGLACEGLMTVPPMGTDPRPVFARLRALRDELRARFPEVAALSMGMTDDFEVAIEEGATIVRVGEAIFGPRPA